LAILGFLRLLASVLGAWLANTLAEFSFEAALRRAKKDVRDAVLSDVKVLAFPFLVDMAVLWLRVVLREQGRG
jgi:hypothetical protein